MEMNYANNTHFHKKSCALGIILKVRVFGTRKWPITASFVRVGTHANVRQVEKLNHARIQCRLLERSKKSRPGGLARVCINTFVDGLYKVICLFLNFKPNY